MNWQILTLLGLLIVGLAIIFILSRRHAGIKEALIIAVGAVLVVGMFLFLGKKGEKIVDRLNKEAEEKGNEVRKDMENLTDHDIVFRYGSIDAARRIAEQRGNSLAHTARSLLLGLGRKGVRFRPPNGG